MHYHGEATISTIVTIAIKLGAEVPTQVDREALRLHIVVDFMVIEMVGLGINLKDALKYRVHEASITEIA